MTRHGFKTLEELREFQQNHPEDYEFLAHSLSEENTAINNARSGKRGGNKKYITPAMVQEMMEKGEV